MQPVYTVNIVQYVAAKSQAIFSFWGKWIIMMKRL